MTIIQPSLFAIFEQFPERREEVKKLFKTNESFKALCEDYSRCAEALQHWNTSLDQYAPDRLREYEALLDELELEILQKVNEET
jgi:hypothetical protein